MRHAAGLNKRAKKFYTFFLLYPDDFVSFSFFFFQLFEVSEADRSAYNDAVGECAQMLGLPIEEGWLVPTTIAAPGGGSSDNKPAPPLRIRSRINDNNNNNNNAAADDTGKLQRDDKSAFSSSGRGSGRGSSFVDAMTQNGGRNFWPSVRSYVLPRYQSRRPTPPPARAVGHGMVPGMPTFGIRKPR
jgi:hypothetical protein